jgi:phosphatidylserine/phosphatidylglycerophosphate/cardiolipin synthase-like enzyme
VRVIDPKDAANPDSGEVLFGSHNLTNAGALFNRDASLLVKDPEVTDYFAKAFLFDWDVLAKQDADELVGGVRGRSPARKRRQDSGVSLSDSSARADARSRRGGCGGEGRPAPPSPVELSGSSMNS